MDAKEWDEELIINVFNGMDAEIIIGILLSESAKEDTWYWAKEVNGVSSVEST